MSSPDENTPRLHRPPAIRCVNALGRALFAIVGERPRLHEGSLAEAAISRTGLTDFGGEAHRDGLRVLIDSLEREAKLNPIGRVAAARQIVDALATRLVFVDAEKRTPPSATTRIERPIFVLGLPRTGTTLLHGLLGEDAAHRSPSSFEVARPCAPERLSPNGDDPRVAAFDRDIDRFRVLAPGIDAIHPMGARLPQECLLITAYAMTSMQFELCFDVPSYQRWYLETDLDEAYRFHRRFLTYLGANEPRRRWVLKSPAHLGSLEALWCEYPDAVVIQTHRDPAKVLPSVSSLHFAVRGTSSDATDPRAIGAEQTELWASMLERTVASRERITPSERVVVDVLYRDLVADPIGTVREIYARLGEALTAETEARMTRFLARNARDKHGTHRYDASSFGLDASAIRTRFDAYTRRFAVPREGASDGRSRE